jgi:hypothetical protein
MQVNASYGRLLAMTAMMFIAMYILMYAMVDTFGNVYNNLNQIYMAGLMTAPMIVIELALMGAMYGNRPLNTIILAASVVAGVVLFILIRQQTAIYDTQFLRSMIPHHAGAILMCEKSCGPRCRDQGLVRLDHPEPTGRDRSDEDHSKPSRPVIRRA